MSLTAEDLLSIRAIVKDEINPLDGRLEAVENDVKEIYDILSKTERRFHKTISALRKELGDEINLLSQEVSSLASRLA